MVVSGDLYGINDIKAVDMSDEGWEKFGTLNKVIILDS